MSEILEHMVRNEKSYNDGSKELKEFVQGRKRQWHDRAKIVLGKGS